MDHDDGRCDAYATAEALKAAGVTLRLHPDGTRLVLPKGQSSLITEGLRRALRENHASLLRSELVREAIRLLQDRLDEAGIDAGSPEGAAVHRATLNTSRVDNLWKNGDLDAFKEALEEMFAPGHEAIDRLLLPAAQEAARDGDQAPRPEGIGGAEPADDPKLFADESPIRRWGAA